jgi:uncharacterized protein YbaP (TraB family)
MNKHIFWLLPALGWFGCQSSQKTATTPSKPAAVAEQLAPQEKSLLWKISGNGLKRPSYLYGTIHLIPKNDFALSEATRTAFDQSQRIAFEIDMKEMTNMRTQLGLMTKAFMAGGKTLRDLLPADDYAFVKGKLEEKGLPIGMLERLKPMFLSMLFATDEPGTTPGADGGMTSVEMELYQMSRHRDLESAGLETAAYQMAVFDSIPYQAQAEMLVQTLRSTAGEGASEYDQMIKMYLDQDIQAMHTMVGDEKFGMSNYEDILLNKRNSNWIPVMGKMMREKVTFFAVGAGHLGGKQGVVALLRQAGYKVDAVF